MYSTAKSYITIGICNYEGDTGVSYSYRNSKPVADETGILFKQFKTEVRGIEWADGYGEDMDIYPAQAGFGESDYFADIHIWSEKGLAPLNTVELIIKVDDVSDIRMKYDFSSDKFQKLNDPARMMVLNEDLSSATPLASDPLNQAKVRFHFDFNLNWQKLDHVTAVVRVKGSGIKDSVTVIEDQFRVVSQVRMVGNFSVEDSMERQLIKGDWVKGGAPIHFYGLEREYADDAITIDPPDMIEIGIKDRSGNIFTSDTTSDLDTTITIPTSFSEMDYELVFLNVTPEADHSDDTKVKVFYTNGFLVQIDSDSPGLPSKMEIIPDDVNQKPRNFDDDNEVFVKWEDAIDPSSGVTTYHLSVNRNRAMSRPQDVISIPKTTGSNVALISDLKQGENKIYLWAEDLVGNTGNEIFTSVIIDVDGVTFGGFYPSTGIWNTQVRPTCSVFINDTLTGVDPLYIQYEISTSGVAGLGGNWEDIQDTYASSTSLRVVVAGWFKNGDQNFIRFRAKDMAGNEWEISDSYNVWVDSESPRFELNSHSEEEFQLDPYQEVSVVISDLQSGVDASSIEYRLTTRGQTQWTPWKAYKDGTSGKSVEVLIKETFRRGDQNYIQIRAGDLAGNDAIESKAYNLRINTFPEIDIISPSSGDELWDDTEIVFDASSSFDPDGDRLEYKWQYSKGDSISTLGEVGRYITRLDPGDYTITISVKDRVGNEVQEVFTITVNQRIPPGNIIEKNPDDPFNPDRDLDGIPDWYEFKYKLKLDVKDATEDPDGDGYTNGQEFGDGAMRGQNLSDPMNPLSHPRGRVDEVTTETPGPFDSEMLPIWAIVIILLLAIVMTMFIVKRKNDRQVNRIKTVRNMRKIMPSVSWDQITTTAYMAPYLQGPALQAAAGPALPSASPTEVDPSTALPPAEPAAVEQAAAQEQAQQPQAAPMEPAPVTPAPVSPQPAPVPAPAPAPDYVPPQ